ncbi:MAG: SLC13 family permease [Gammaproteobacteria bacterium]|nr:SLC13 family permease [Gammaproteobacteria bacterium]
MTLDQGLLFAIMGCVFALLLWGRIRYDVVAFGALVVALVVGAVPADQAFSGFGHPATVIIALVLIASRGLQNSGAIELIARYVVDASRSLMAHISLIGVAGAILSSFMNNVAALALLMPVDMQAASKANRSPALTLMPLSFATILGGMVTLIGTPPNIVVATFRGEALGEPYGMFDFAPVGIAVAVIGILFVATIGWRLLPAERRQHAPSNELRQLDGYIAEGRVPGESGLIGKRLNELYPQAEEMDVGLLGIVRNGIRLAGTARGRTLEPGDLMVLEGSPKAIELFIGTLGLEFAGNEVEGGVLGDNLSMLEVVVLHGSRMEGRAARDLNLLYGQEVLLMGVSREGRHFRDRVRELRLRAGDILLLLGDEKRLAAAATWMGCLPLAERGLQVLQRNRALGAIAVFVAAIVAASIGWLYLPVALALVALAYVLSNIVSLNQIYDSVEWPVVVLLGSLIPIGGALEASGGTALIAGSIIELTAGWSAFAVLAVLMIVTMTLSDVLNNVATALIAAPIGLDIANRLGVSPDPFLMAVAVAASCAFLTPIGHKNNTIVMGPGGYRFGDYWRMGLPLEILVVVVSLPVILWAWPLSS